MINICNVARYQGPTEEELKKLRDSHVLLSSFEYERTPLFRGYTDKILTIDVGTKEASVADIPAEVKEKFIGGRGYCLRYLWDAVNPETRWDSPENEIVMSSGPIGGITQYAGTGKTLIATISPLTDIPIDSNVGGFFGPYLKFAGFDALEIRGKSDQDIVVVIDATRQTVTFEEAPLEHFDAHILCEELTALYADDENDKKNIAVVTAGSAAEYSNIAMLNFSFYDVRRGTTRIKQAGRGGIGRVFRNKGIKALVCKVDKVKGNLNNVYDIGIINKTGLRFHREMVQNDAKQNDMRGVGTSYSLRTLADYDLVPTNNFKFGDAPGIDNMTAKVLKSDWLTQGAADGCWYGCSMACAKASDHFLLETGPYKGQRVCVDGLEYESASGLGPNCGIYNPRDILEINFYCDTYGIDTISYGTMTAFLMECYERGILNKERTGGLDLTWGNAADDLEMLHQMSRNEGFGKIAALGIHKQKAYFAEMGWGDLSEMNDFGMEQKGLEYSEYSAKESLAQQGGYGLTNKGPQHDEAWLIFMDQVNNQIPTFEDKAEALFFYPMFRTWFGLMGLCKLPWNDIVPADNALTDDPKMVPEHVENYKNLYYGVTGQRITTDDMILQSERVYDFQRIFNIRMGKGLRADDAIPYRAAGPVFEEEYLSRQERYDRQLVEIVGLTEEEVQGMSVQEKMAATRNYREDQYQTLIDTVYRKRGWTRNGVPTVEHLRELGMDLPELLAVVEPLLAAEEA